MKRVSLFITLTLITTSFAWAGLRGSDVNVRANTQQNPRSQNTDTTKKTNTLSPNNARSNGSATRSVARRVSSTTPRSNGTTSTRTASINARNGTTVSVARSATTRTIRGTTPKIRARAATMSSGALTSTFTEGYSECHDAYFTCMDQFCATLSDSYRRCVCSSKLENVKARERILGQTASQLQDFKDLNLDSILKTPGEVHAMLSASEGEATLEKTKDNSESAQQLHAITSVLNNTRTKATSTQGRLDAGGDISAIWATTDLASGADIATLTGESLYNAVHAQCAELVSPQCPKKSTLNMVISAYGMYIENDCSLLLNALDKQATNANSSIRQAEREMTSARLDNYNAHNSSSINDCIAKVRKDITADTACGENYVHCLDFTGLYLNRTTGEPIYSADFYKINEQISLKGDVLSNKANQKIVMNLNNKKTLASASLETCRDVADSVWTEYLHQAITEIYQGQQSRVRQVKDECLDVVNKCYDEQTQSLRDYSKIEEQYLLGSRLELSEELCKEMLTTCSNLYGNGSNGLQLLLTEMHNVTNQKIAKNCATTLQEYAEKLCKVPARDTLHKYPYGCRMYAPGDAASATQEACLALTSGSFIQVDTYRANVWYYEHSILSRTQNPGLGINVSPRWETYDYVTSNINQDSSNPDGADRIYSGWLCPVNRNYLRCKEGYILMGSATNRKCWRCQGGAAACPEGSEQLVGACNPSFANSLYQKMVAHAKEYCTRPSESSHISMDIMGDVNKVMDRIRVDMSNVLSEDCERYEGKWETEEPYDEDKINKAFYRVTNAHEEWGWCRIATESETSTTQSTTSTQQTQE